MGFFDAAVYDRVVVVGQSVARIFAIDGRGEASDKDGFPYVPSVVVGFARQTVEVLFANVDCRVHVASQRI